MTRYSFFILLLFQFHLFLPGIVLAEKPDNPVHFKDLAITTSNSHLLLFATLTNEMQTKLNQELHSGIPMYFTFSVNLYQTSSDHDDKKLTSIDFSHTLRYDTLKEQYLLTLEEEKHRTRTFTNLAKAVRSTNEINGLKVAPLSTLQENSSYKILFKAKLYQKTLPMNLHQIIPFVSMWDIETTWQAIEFTY